MALKLLTFITLILFLWGFFSQFFWPAWNNRRLFPMFRRSSWKLKQEIIDANTRRHLAKQRVAAARTDVSATEMEIEAEKAIDEAYDELIRKVENKK